MLTGKGIISELQGSVLNIFSTLPDQEQFFLTGGTALAEFYLGHRYSYDLDLFTTQAELVLPFSYQLEKRIKESDLQVSIVRRFTSFVQFLITQGTESLKVDLAYDSPIRLATPEVSSLGIMVNDYLDLQADKTLAFFGRVEPRDAVDFYFLMQKSSIDELISLARQKDTGFDLYWFAIALSKVSDYPDEIDRWPVKLLLPFDPVVMKQTFRDLAIKIIQDQTSAPKSE